MKQKTRFKNFRNIGYVYRLSVSVPKKPYRSNPI